MPPSPLQHRILRAIAKHRTPSSHIGGGVALNFDLARYSHDLDVFHDPVVDVEATADADAVLLEKAGFEVRWLRRTATMVTAEVADGGDVTSIDWVRDSAFRFFPVQPHDTLGWALHPFDLATNKALAAAARREPRDAVDIVTIHETLFPLGAVAWAAVAKDEGYSPELLLNFIVRFAVYHEHDLARVDIEPRMSAADLSIRIKKAVWEARDFVERMPPHLVGKAFMKDGRVVQPDPERLDDYTVVEGTVGGVWPIAR